jgi:hypothetical protein|tara:strand:- start:712 stop:1569 length:858 start_codon:yes stop_codon:yes gene_type:complete
MTTAQKKIDTLVEDIYSLFTSNEPTKIPANVLQDFAKDVTDAVVNALTEERKPRNNLRLSMIGQPARKVWYSVRSTEQEELAGSDYIKFLYGDILEALLVFLSKVSGHKVSDQQKQVVLNDVVGHQDAVVDNVLVDFKSASSFSFKKFTEGMVFKDDPFGYVAQLSAYAQANNAKEAGWIVIDKTTGQIAYCPVHQMEMINASQKIDYLRNAIKDSEPPSRCYDDVPDGKSGNMQLATGCNYCAYKFDCWSDANNGKGLRAFQYANSVKYLTKVDREPNVPELQV